MLCDTGIDSMRFSLNSVREEFYNRYYRPVGYSFADVKESVGVAREKGLFTMINYLVSPGLNDHPDEVAALLEFIAATGVDMIQMRNLSIDPDYYNEQLRVKGKGIGMYRMMEVVKKAFPRIQYGYFNRTRENFYPEGLETAWPIKMTP
jgi:pyruvate-formate lyase-activating enzyme